VTPHNHRTRVPGCFRCELSDDEVTNMTDQDNERVRGLAKSLEAGAHPWPTDAIAQRILSDQPTHAKALLAAGFDVRVFMDAAVEAGELEISGERTDQHRHIWYRPPKPKLHVHEPIGRIDIDPEGKLHWPGGDLLDACADCGSQGYEDWHVPDVVWKRYAPENATLCWPCFQLRTRSSLPIKWPEEG
jgi:hypothetical protein